MSVYERMGELWPIWCASAFIFGLVIGGCK